MAGKVSDTVKRLVYADPDRTPESILGELDGQGLKSSLATVSSYRIEFLASIAILRELGAFAVAPPEAVPAAQKVKKLSRAGRWAKACADAGAALSELREVQEEYEEWRDNLPEGLQNGPTGEKLDEVCELDIESAIEVVDEAKEVDLPLGFGRD